MQEYGIVAAFRIDSEIMQDPGDISHIMVYDGIALAKVCFEEGDESAEVLFLVVIIEGEEDEVGGEEEDEKEECWTKESLQFLEVSFDGRKG
jgi:hypothetical protein